MARIVLNPITGNFDLINTGFDPDKILTGVTACCPDLQVLIDETGNVLTGE
jgi:hypothetical protein